MNSLKYQFHHSDNKVRYILVAGFLLGGVHLMGLYMRQVFFSRLLADVTPRLTDTVYILRVNLIIT